VEVFICAMLEEARTCNAAALFLKVGLQDQDQEAGRRDHGTLCDFFLKAGAEKKPCARISVLFRWKEGGSREHVDKHDCFWSRATAHS
jgi:hypothetical protein